MTPTGQRPRQGKIIAVIGAKGGVGTTTLVDLVAGLGMRNYKSVAVEMRPYFGTLARHFGVAVTATLNDLLEMTARAITEKQLTPRLLSTQGIQILAGPQQLKEYREPQPEQVEAILENLTDMAEYVVVDLPHMPSSCQSSDLPRRPHDCHCRRAGTLLCRLHPCLNRVDAAPGPFHPPLSSLSSSIVSSRVQNDFAGDLERTLGCELLGTITSAPDMAVVALNMGSPLIISAPTSLVAGTFPRRGRPYGGDKASKRALVERLSARQTFCQIRTKEGRRHLSAAPLLILLECVDLSSLPSYLWCAGNPYGLDIRHMKLKADDDRCSCYLFVHRVDRRDLHPKNARGSKSVGDDLVWPRLFYAGSTVTECLTIAKSPGIGDMGRAVMMAVKLWGCPHTHWLEQQWIDLRCSRLCSYYRYRQDRDRRGMYRDLLSPLPS